MHIGRSIPPASSPLTLRDLINGCGGLLRGEREVERFRREILDVFAVRHCFLVSSGKAALTIILQALHDRRRMRREVLIPAFGCYAVPSAVCRAGLTPRLCDVDPQTLDYDERDLRRCLAADHPSAGIRGAADDARPGLLAAVSVHLFGKPADTVRLREMIRDPDTAVIEDAAQAMGAKSGGRWLGLRGDVGFFSLGRGKVWTTGEGGIIVTDREDIAERIRRRTVELPEYRFVPLLLLAVRTAALAWLQRPEFFWIPRLMPFLRVGDTIFDPSFPMRRFSAFQAGLARRWHERLNGFRHQRRLSIERWDDLPLPAGISRYRGRAAGEPVDFIRYPLRVRPPGLWSKILERGFSAGLGIMLTYPDSIDGIPELKGAFAGQEFPAARRLAHEILTLPVHPLLTEKDRDKIANLVGSLEGSPPAGTEPTAMANSPAGHKRGLS